MKKLREFIDRLRRRWGGAAVPVAAMVRKLALTYMLMMLVGLSVLADRAVKRADLQLNPFSADCGSAVQLCSR